MGLALTCVAAIWVWLYALVWMSTPDKDERLSRFPRIARLPRPVANVAMVANMALAGLVVLAAACVVGVVAIVLAVHDAVRRPV